MNIPLHDFVIIKPIQTNRTAGGLELPSDSKSPFGKGEVLAVGPGTIGHNDQPVPLSVRVGDIVLFMDAGCVEFERGLLTTREGSIIHIVEENKKKREEECKSEMLKAMGSPMR